ncbi:MAG: 16S rRNA processing protein RimM [Pontimonas sp.]|jgi:16S rRNA processing protein RimM
MPAGSPPTAPRPERVELRVARLVRAHGLKGALKLEVYTDDPQLRFVVGREFKLQVPTDSPWFGKTVKLASIREVNSSPVAFFDGIDDRDSAESIVKAILWIEHDPETRPTEKDAWFDHELVGLTVMRDGLSVGTILRLEHFPAQDLLVISAGEAEILLPFVEVFVPHVDIAGGTVTITPPGGLFEPLEESEGASS